MTSLRKLLQHFYFVRRISLITISLLQRGLYLGLRLEISTLDPTVTSFVRVAGYNYSGLALIVPTLDQSVFCDGRVVGYIRD